ncbi:MAG: hypothetical protein HYT98_05060 [Candidatus Sungbacteria bacterium]|nr:hypothetical protein [Candidatus Sungbacteria bacterium]
MAYNIQPHYIFERSFAKLPKGDKQRIAGTLERLADNPELIGAPMGNLPPDLRGLHKIRIGDWRIFFWVDHTKREISPYDIDTRDKAYKNLYRRK